MRLTCILTGMLVIIPSFAYADTINLRCDEQNHSENFNVSINNWIILYNGAASPDVDLISMDGSAFSFSRNISGVAVKAVYSINKDLSYKIQMYINGALAGNPQVGSCVRR